jgi:NitT/TauT family transport system permease protein
MTPTQVRKQLTPIVSTLALFVVWEAACWAFQIPTFILPRPTEALAALIENWPGIWPNALHTLITTLIGFGAAVAVGMMLGIAVGTSALVYDANNPLLIGFNAIPKVALVPILVLFAGIGTVPAVITAFLTAFFPIVVNVATGIATVEPELSDVLQLAGAKQTDIVRKVGIPIHAVFLRLLRSRLPWLLSARLFLNPSHRMWGSESDACPRARHSAYRWCLPGRW